MSDEPNPGNSSGAAIFLKIYGYALVCVLLILSVMLVGWFYAAEWYRERLLTEERTKVAAEIAVYAADLQNAIDQEVEALERDIIRNETTTVTTAAHLVSLKLSSGSASNSMHLVAEFAIYEFGIAKSAVLASIALEPILESVGIMPMPQHLTLSIRDSRGNSFYGGPDVFALDPALAHINLPGDDWDIAAIPSDGWSSSIYSSFALVKWGFFILIILLCLSIYQIWFHYIRLASALHERNSALRARVDLEELVLSISKDLMDQPVDKLDDIIISALGAVGAYEKADRCCIFIFDNEYANCAYEWLATGILPRSQRRRIPLTTFLGGRAQMRESGAVAISRSVDLSDQPANEREYAEMVDVKSSLNVPLVCSGRVIGSMELQTLCAEKRWSQESATLLRLVADILANALKRQETEAALRESEERHRQLVELSPDMISVQSEGQIVFINPAGVRMLGAESIDQVIGRPVLDFVVPSWRQTALQRLELLYQGKSLPAVETRLVRFDGSEVAVELVAIAVPHQPRPTVLGIARDISDRKRAEDALRASEERYRTVVEASRDVIYVIPMTTDGNAYEYVSPAAATVLGFSAEYLQTVSAEWALSRFHPDDRLQVEAHLNALRQSERLHNDSVTSEYRWRCADGIYHWFSDTQVVVRDETGRPVRMVGSKRDISARKEAERRLLESEARFRNLFENIGDAFLLLDEGLRVVDCKDSADRVVGFEASNILGKRFDEVVGDLEIEYQGPDMLLDEVIHTQKPTIYRSVRLIKGKGGRCQDAYLDVLAYPVHLGGRPHIALLCRNITELHRLEIEQKRIEFFEALGHLALEVAHDFGKFLAIIKAEVELLRQHSLSASSEDAELDAISEAVDSGVALTQELVMFSRGQPIHREILHMNLLVEETRKMLESLLRPGISLHLDLCADPLFFWGDEAKFQRVLVNLTSNALNAMPAGGRLTIGTRRAEVDATAVATTRLRPGLYALLIVRDEGIGISDEDKERIFDPFFTTQQSVSHVGLGLSVVYGIVQQHQGYIDFESQIGKGTTFYLYFPVIDDETLIEAIEGGA